MFQDYVFILISFSLGRWLDHRQVDSGGLNGRPEKQCDLCYSWWSLSAMMVLSNISCMD